ncbi:MAG: TatD family hydrolase [Dechloromonas sp.]|nr:TatD family hydrolase [Dechloromonas sp.]
MLIDTHCHLDAAEFEADRDAVHAAALAGGVERIVVPAVAVDGFQKAKTVVERYPGCVAAYGIHPLYVMQAKEADLAVLRDWLAKETPVAVGEVGLDGYVTDVDPGCQEFFFVEQLKLAREFDLPVLLHVRRAVDQILKHLRRIRVRGGIAHAFNGSRQQADQFIKLGFKLGFGGAMTFSGSTRIRALAAELPLDAIVLETDAPDIPPAWLGGGRNTPGELPRIAAVLAELRGVDVAHIAAATTASARTILSGL